MSVRFGDTVYFVDIDETLFHQSNGLIHVKDWNGKVVESLTAEELNSYKLKPGYSYDHSDFASANLFINNAIPIECTLKKLKELINENRNLEQPNLILILTARGDFDDKEKILDFFDKEGVQIRKYNFVDFVRTGNINDKVFDTSKKKQAIVLSMLIANTFKNFVMFDDSIYNLEKFYEVKKSVMDGQNVNFSFFHVIHDNIDGKHSNYRMVEVKDENAIKYIDIYKAKRTLARYGVNVWDHKIQDVKVGRPSRVQEIDKKIVASVETKESLAQKEEQASKTKEN